MAEINLAVPNREFLDKLNNCQLFKDDSVNKMNEIRDLQYSSVVFCSHPLKTLPVLWTTPRVQSHHIQRTVKREHGALNN